MIPASCNPPRAAAVNVCQQLRRARMVFSEVCISAACRAIVRHAPCAVRNGGAAVSCGRLSPASKTSRWRAARWRTLVICSQVDNQISRRRDAIEGTLVTEGHAKCTEPAASGRLLRCASWSRCCMCQPGCELAAVDQWRCRPDVRHHLEHAQVAGFGWVCIGILL
jgi:hypothetical protein